MLLLFFVIAIILNSCASTIQIKKERAILYYENLDTAVVPCQLKDEIQEDYAKTLKKYYIASMDDVKRPIKIVEVNNELPEREFIYEYGSNGELIKSNYNIYNDNLTITSFEKIDSKIPCLESVDLNGLFLINNGEKFDIVSNDNTKGVIYFKDEVSQKNILAVIGKLHQNKKKGQNLIVLFLVCENQKLRLMQKFYYFWEFQNTFFEYNVDKKLTWFGRAESEGYVKFVWNGTKFIDSYHE